MMRIEGFAQDAKCLVALCSPMIQPSQKANCQSWKPRESKAWSRKLRPGYRPAPMSAHSWSAPIVTNSFVPNVAASVPIRIVVIECAMYVYFRDMSVASADFN